MSTPTPVRPRAARWSDYPPGVPRWARTAAHVIAVCTIPASLWRLGIVLGVPVGYDLAWIRRSGLDTAFGGFRMVALCVLSELLALLAFGLVQRWGEVGPPWAFGLRGRAIPSWVPSSVAAVGALALIAVWTVGVPYAALSGTTFDAGTEPGPATAVQLAAYAPMVLWGPLLLALAVHHRERRRRGGG